MNGVKYDIGSIDLDWVSKKHRDDGQPNSGVECLAEWLEQGWEVIAVWWDGSEPPHNRVLLKRESREEPPI